MNAAMEQKRSAREARDLLVHRVCSQLDPNFYRMTASAQAGVYRQAVALGLLKEVS